MNHYLYINYPKHYLFSKFNHLKSLIIYDFNDVFIYAMSALYQKYQQN